ncbi:MAG: calcium-binding protein [Alsobacter sp.]
MPLSIGTPSSGDDSLVGTLGNDTIDGLEGADTILGLAGVDYLIGGPGSDSIDGGDNYDTVMYQTSGIPVGYVINANLSTGTITTSSGDTDRISNVEEVMGTEGADTFTGSTSYTAFDGLGGNDVFIAGAVSAAARYDFDASFGGTSGVIVNLSGSDLIAALVSGGPAYTVHGSQARDGFGATDSFVGNVNGIFGTAQSDVFKGPDTGFANFVGLQGADTLIGGTGPGAQMTADYSPDDNLGISSGIIANLSQAQVTATVASGTWAVDPGQIRDGYGSTDIVQNATGVLATGLADYIVGNSSKGTSFFGRGGSDTLIGGTGSDFFDPGDGADTIVGGGSGDFDLIKFTTINSAPPAVGLLVTMGSTSGTGVLVDPWGNTDTFQGIESIEGTSVADTFLGGAQADNFVGGAGNDSLSGGAGDDFLDPGAGADTIDAGGGGDFDVLSYSRGSSPPEISGLLLTGADVSGSGTVIDPWGGTDVYQNVERVVGNLLADTFVGGAGTEEFVGGNGADSLNGGAGHDVINYDAEKFLQAPSNGVTVSFASGIAIDSWGNQDLISSFEQVRATDYADSLVGSDRTDDFEDFDARGGNDTVDARGGDDYIAPGAGADQVDGGQGFDTLGYGSPSTPAQGILVLASDTPLAGSVVDPWGNTDTYVNIERVQGSRSADSFVGGAANDDFTGGNGADTFDGGGGNDQVAYTPEFGMGGGAVGVIVDLLAGTGVDAWGNTDILINIERVRGTNFGDLLQGSPGTAPGTTGNDSLFGLDGADTILARGGADFIDAGNGSDSVEGGGGNDLIFGGDGNDTLLGQGGGDTFVGGAGADSIDGGSGIDTVDFSTDGGPSGVQVNLFGLGPQFGIAADNALDSYGNLDLVVNIRNAVGTAFSDLLLGGTHANLLQGGVGADTLQGGGDNDTLSGGDGVDIALFSGNRSDYLVALDQQGFLTVTDLRAGSPDGSDSLTDIEVLQFADVTLAGGSVVDRFLSGTPNADTFSGGAGNDTLIGLDQNDSLSGLQGNDSLDGGTGADTLVGGSGDDVFVVDNGRDILVESPDAGRDTVLSSITFTLAADFENLTLTGADSINGTGNSLDNVLVGNGAANRLTGNDGADTLDGGLGADTLIGGLGNDTFVVDEAGDAVFESAGEGIDTIFSSITKTLGSTVENLVLTGVLGINGTGNASDNVLTGNEAGNALNGAGGNDTLDGAGGNDVLIGGAGADSLSGGTGTDTASYATAATGVFASLAAPNLNTGDALGDSYLSIENLLGSGQVDTLVGDGNANRLDGGVGADSLVGGGGDDVYVVDNSGDRVLESSAAGGLDTVLASVQVTLSGNVENLTLVQGFSINGTGNALDNLITGNDQANVLNGLVGNDTLVGGVGNDQLIGGAGADSLVGGSGTLDLASYATSTLAGGLVANLADALQNTGDALGDRYSGVEGLIGSGFADTLTGDGGSNRLSGGAGNDVIDGGVGADTMLGGAGDDTFTVDNASDGVFENAGEGLDTVYSSVKYTLSANVENLVLTGSAGINANGNALGNVITGNDTANALNGLDGADTLNGAGGNDVLIGGVGADLLDGGLGTDTASYATALTGVTVNLAAMGLNTGDAQGDQYISIEKVLGSGQGDQLTGDANANNFNGGGGADTLDGGLGNDTLAGGTGGDLFVFASGYGKDAITDFVAADDTVQLTGLSGVFADGAAAYTASVQIGNDVVLTLDAANSLTFKNILKSALSAADFSVT